MFVDRKGTRQKTYQRGWVPQRTLKSSISCTGIGLHCGQRVSMTLHPAEPNSGIMFIRSDVVAKSALIPALWSHVVDTRLCTVIGNADRVVVGTIEHLLAAFAGVGVDNVVVEINGSEVPIMDGSAAPFVCLIEGAGLCEQDARRRIIRLRRKVQVQDGKRLAVLAPTVNGFSVSCEILFPSQIVSHQSYCVTVTPHTFCVEISRARTFGFLEEVTQLRESGLARGGSLKNAIVISGEKVLNTEGLRFQDECVRHKILDAVGDLYLAGRPLNGRFYGSCSGHALNNKLLRALLADHGAWREDDMTSSDVAFSRRSQDKRSSFVHWEESHIL